VSRADQLDANVAALEVAWDDELVKAATPCGGSCRAGRSPKAIVENHGPLTHHSPNKELVVAIEEGKAAPAFSLQDANGKTVALKDFKGKNVVVYFYPKDDTPGHADKKSFQRSRKPQDFSCKPGVSSFG